MGFLSGLFGGGSKTTTTTSNDINITTQTNINLEELANATAYSADKSYMASLQNLTETQKQNAINNDLAQQQIDLQKQELAQSATLKNKEIDLQLLQIQSDNAKAQAEQTIINNYNESFINSFDNLVSKGGFLIVIGGLFYILKKGG